MTVKTPRILEVTKEQTMLIEKRYDEYQGDLVRCLLEIVAAQGEGSSEKKRREKVAKIVDALGAKLAAEVRSEA